MSDSTNSEQEKTEAPTEERRESFREKGDILYSKDITQTAALAAGLLFFSWSCTKNYQSLLEMMRSFMFNLAYVPKEKSWNAPIVSISYTFIKFTVPFILAMSLGAFLSGFLQTKLNFSWDRVSFKISRLNPADGFLRLISFRSLFEICKSFIKALFIGIIGFSILSDHYESIPNYIFKHPSSAFNNFFVISKNLLIWSIVILIFVSFGDYFYIFYNLEKRLKMSKQEVKEDYKNREADPHVKQKLRRMQREFSRRKTIALTKTATVVITNPTHFAVALKYELGMRAPIILAKGKDHLALSMKEAAKEAKVVIVENKPLARALYPLKLNEEIPEKFYKAISEIIKYVFKIKKMSLYRSRI